MWRASARGDKAFEGVKSLGGEGTNDDPSSVRVISVVSSIHQRKTPVAELLFPDDSSLDATQEQTLVMVRKICKKGQENGTRYTLLLGSREDLSLCSCSCYVCCLKLFVGS